MYVSDALVLLVLVVTVIMIYQALRGWWGYRKALSKFDCGNYPVPPPRIWAFLAEAFMLVAMVLVAVIFVRFNPFAIPSN